MDLNEMTKKRRVSKSGENQDIKAESKHSTDKINGSTAEVYTITAVCTSNLAWLNYNHLIGDSTCSNRRLIAERSKHCRMSVESSLI